MVLLLLLSFPTPPPLTLTPRPPPQVENEAGFRAVFAATSQLRTAQDEEARLADNVQKQLAALADAEERARAAGSRAQEAERTARAEPQDLVRALEREVAALRTQVNSTLPDSIAATRNQLERLHSSRGQPARTAREVDVLAAEVHQLEECVCALDSSRF